MPRPAKRREPPIIFKYPAQVEVRRPKFEPFASLRQLDLEKLASAEIAKVELGYLKTECCQQLVRAIVRKGMVTEIQVQPCDEPGRIKPSPEMMKLVAAALKRAAKGSPRPPKFPMTFPAMLESLISVTTITCIQICVFGWCIACCIGPTGNVFCGRVTIDTTSGPYPEPT
jgi:hypothetical protein